MCWTLVLWYRLDRGEFHLERIVLPSDEVIPPPAHGQKRVRHADLSPHGENPLPAVKQVQVPVGAELPDSDDCLQLAEQQLRALRQQYLPAVVAGRPILESGKPG